MKLSKSRKRTAKKLVLPLIAVGMMTTMMFMESASRRSHGPSSSAASMQQSPAALGAAARVRPDLRQR